jgi:hypothetical protein
MKDDEWYDRVTFGGSWFYFVIESEQMWISTAQKSETKDRKIINIPKIMLIIV